MRHLWSEGKCRRCGMVTSWPKPDPTACKLPPVSPSVGAELKRARLALGLSLRAAAELAGSHYQNIRRVESGNHSITIDTLVLLCDALGLSPSVVLAAALETSPPASAVRERGGV